MIGFLSLIPGGRMVQGMVVAAVLASAVGGVTLAKYRYDNGKRNEGRAEVQTKWDAAEALRTTTALEASEAARIKENASKLSLQRIQNALVKEKEARAVASAALNDSLRQFKASLADNSTTGTDSSAPGRINGAGGLERELLGNCSTSLAEMAITADRLENKIVGLQGYVKDICMSNAPTISP